MELSKRIDPSVFEKGFQAISFLRSAAWFTRTHGLPAFSFVNIDLITNNIEIPTNYHLFGLSQAGDELFKIFIELVDSVGKSLKVIPRVRRINGYQVKFIELKGDNSSFMAVFGLRKIFLHRYGQKFGKNCNSRIPRRAFAKVPVSAIPVKSDWFFFECIFINFGFIYTQDINPILDQIRLKKPSLVNSPDSIHIPRSNFDFGRGITCSVGPHMGGLGHRFVRSNRLPSKLLGLTGLHFPEVCFVAHRSF